MLMVERQLKQLRFMSPWAVAMFRARPLSPPRYQKPPGWIPPNSGHAGSPRATRTWTVRMPHRQAERSKVGKRGRTPNIFCSELI